MARYADKLREIGKFPERLRELKESNQETNEEMGARIGVDMNTVSRYLTGNVYPHKSTLESIANAYRVDPLWLAGESEEKAPFNNESRPIKVIADIKKNKEGKSIEEIVGKKNAKESDLLVGSIKDGVPTYEYQILPMVEYVDKYSDIDFGYKLESTFSTTFFIDRKSIFNNISVKVPRSSIVFVSKQIKPGDGEIICLVEFDSKITLANKWEGHTIPLVPEGGDMGIDDAEIMRELQKNIVSFGKIVGFKYSFSRKQIPYWAF